jgi:uncharacterized membrane protein YgcG
MDPITIALGLAQFAPSIMKFFGVGDKPVAVAEQVVKIAQTVTGKGTPEEATAAMRADPALAQQFNQAVLAADTKLEELYLADKANARARDIEVRKLDGGKNHRADIMLVAAFVAVIAIAALLALGKVDGATAVGGFLLTIGGMFARNIGTAFDFEFGSSRGSRDKDAAIAQLTK